MWAVVRWTQENLCRHGTLKTFMTHVTDHPLQGLTMPSRHGVDLMYGLEHP